MKLEESVKVESTALVCLYCSKILVDASKHRFFSYSHIVLEEHGDLPVEEYCRTDGSDIASCVRLYAKSRLLRNDSAFSGS